METVEHAKPKRRHVFILISFMFVVIVPILFVGGYLQTRAKSLYASTLAFTIRSEEMQSPTDFLGGLSALGSVSSTDSDILSEYLVSQNLVELLEKKLEVSSIYSKYFSEDPIFAFNPSGLIEDLTRYWRRNTDLFYDQGTNLIEMRVYAYDPKIAQNIAKTVLEAATTKINQLNQIAREDKLKYSKAELEIAERSLLDARTKLTLFRTKNKISDPKAEIDMLANVIAGLQLKLSELQTELDFLLMTAGKTDPRVNEIKRRIEVVESRIESQRNQFASNDPEASNFSQLIVEFESLVVFREYAEQRYLAALAKFDATIAEADRQSRYLATYIEPTLAERAEYPQKVTLFTIFTVMVILFWSIIVLAYYAIKDRR